MKVAIFGAGFAGFAVSWFLLNYSLGTASIDIFDSDPLEDCFSCVSSGLLHEYLRDGADKTWNPQPCIKEVHRLITEASAGLGKPIILSKGILDLSFTDNDSLNLKKCANKDMEWWDEKKCKDVLKGLNMPKNGGALFIKNGLTIDVHAYLQGLWQKIAKMGVNFYQKTQILTQDLEKYNCLLIALGHKIKNFPQFKSLPITYKKVQSLEIEWPTSIPALPFSINSSKYLVMSEDLKRCRIGESLESEFETVEPNQKLAEKEIFSDAISFLPALADSKILKCNASIRACTKSGFPIAGQAAPSVYFFTGLGHKELLYHARVGKLVARAMLSHDIKHIPSELLFNISSNQPPV